MDEDESETLVNIDDVTWDYKNEYGGSDVVGRVYEFDFEDIRMSQAEYKDLIDCLEDEDFALKKEYMKIREYLEDIQEKQKTVGDSLFDLF